jgi:hypothetical protein
MLEMPGRTGTPGIGTMKASVREARRARSGGAKRSSRQGYFLRYMRMDGPLRPLVSTELAVNQ